MFDSQTVAKICKRIREQVNLFKYEITKEQEEEILTLYELNNDSYNEGKLALHIESYIQRMAESPDLLWRQQRRATVYAKTIPQESFVLPTFKKSHKTVEFLMSRLGTDIPFCLLSEEQKKSLVDSMYPLEVEAGIVLIREGDVGTEMYIVENGEFSITVGGKQVNTLGVGKVFGELALLHGIPRTATVTATRRSSVWSAEQTSFSCIRVRDQIYRIGLAKDAIGTNPYFKDVFATPEDAQLILNSASSKFIAKHTTFTPGANEIVIVVKNATINDGNERQVSSKDILVSPFYCNTDVDCVILKLAKK